MKFRLAPSLTAALMFLSSAGSASAGVILGPAAVTANVPGQTSPYLAINQTGLLTGYTSLSTDFDLYLASNPLHQPDVDTGWITRKGFSHGLVDFDLGGTYVIESMALWNFGASEPLNLIGFELHASNDASFATSTLLGSFQANPLLTTGAGTAAEVFSFAPTSAAFIRMFLLSSNESLPTNVGIGEVAFEVHQNPVPTVPEPASLLLLGSGLGAIASARRKRAAAVLQGPERPVKKSN